LFLVAETSDPAAEKSKAISSGAEAQNIVKHLMQELKAPTPWKMAA
jgi:hypothetical protein